MWSCCDRHRGLGPVLHRGDQDQTHPFLPRAAVRGAPLLATGSGCDALPCDYEVSYDCFVISVPNDVKFFFKIISPRLCRQPRFVASTGLNDTRCARYSPRSRPSTYQERAPKHGQKGMFWCHGSFYFGHPVFGVLHLDLFSVFLNRVFLSLGLDL